MPLSDREFFDKTKEILAKFNVKIDGTRNPHSPKNYFTIVHIGVGKPMETLNAIAAEFDKLGCGKIANVVEADNKDHPDCGKFFVEIDSLWIEPEWMKEL